MTAHKHHKIYKLGLMVLLSGLLMAVPAIADGAGAHGEETSYSFARIVEGNATLLEVGGDRDTLEVHQPILVGDELWVPHGSRLELALADRNLLRIQGESQAVFENIAYSADTGDRTTVLGISEGKMQLIVPEDALGDALPQIQTPDGTIYIHREGSFRLSVGNGWTELVVREGLAEMVTERSSLLVHPGEAGWFEGGTRPRSEVRLAGYRDELERWGDRLSEEARLASVPYVDPSLSYAAAPLADHGAWVEVSGRRAWRPRVEVSWRPYSYGYWRHTPVGLTWVSYDPWGYVTHHYGSWDYSSGYGWVWYPGRVYAPARVTWYWGPSYVGWCPTGYYAHHYRYRHSGFGLHFGTYGWARGSWDYYSHWTFSLNLDFGRRHYRDRSYRRGYRDGYRDGYSDHGHYGRHWAASDLARDRREIDRGVITTDPGRERRTASERFDNLERRLTEVNRVKGSEAPDVTDFVARRTLDGSVATAVLTKPTVERASSSKPTLSARGDWATGAKPLPNLAGTTRSGTTAASATRAGTVRNPADKPLPSASASKPAYRDKPTVDSRKPTVDSRKPTTITRTPATISRKPLNDRSTTPRPVVIERRTSKPTATRPEASKPGSRTTSPRVTRPDYTKPTPRTTTPRTTRPSTTKPTSPRVTRPDYTKPTPRTTTPRATTPRTTRPSTTKPSTRVTRPDYTKPPSRTTTPRTTTPRTTRPSTTKPPSRTTSPRVTRPSTSKPTSRATSPRVTRPSSSKPSTRVTRPSSSKPSTRVTPPSSRSRPQASRPAPSRPAPRATKPAPSKPKASSSSRSSGSRNASKPAKSKNKKKD